jgi:hypothetical protein
MELRRRRGHGHAGGPGVLERDHASSRWHNGLGHGLDTGTEAPEGTNLRQSGLAATLAYFGKQLREQ